MQIIYFIVKNIVLLHKDISMMVKLEAITKIAILLSIPASIIGKISDWSVSNQDYIAGVLACIAIDHLLGSIYHAFKLNDFTFRKNITGLLTKLMLCVVAAILFEVIRNTVKEVSFVYAYLKNITRLMIILYPAGSAFLTMSALTKGLFPPLGWINKLTAFNKTLDLTKFPKDGPCNATEDKILASEGQK